jgi:hypothetical protein
MSAKDQKIVIGGIPRADLLPPELAQEKKAKAQRSNLLALLVLVILLVGLAYGGVTVLTATTQAQLDAANLESADLLAQQGEYIEVRQLAAQVDSAEAARRIGTSTEIDWKAIQQEILSRGSNAVYLTMKMTSATPMAPFAASSIPLEKPRVAEIVMTGAIMSPEGMATWLRNLEEMPGYADATASSLENKLGVYTYTLTIHLNEDAYTNRFAEETQE